MRDGLLVVSELLSESILIYDTSEVSDSQKGRLLKQLDLPGVGALAFASDGKLLVAQDKQIKSFTLDRETLALQRRNRPDQGGAGGTDATDGGRRWTYFCRRLG